jgi:hypothetical protein
LALQAWEVSSIETAWRHQDTTTISLRKSGHYSAAKRRMFRSAISCGMPPK